MARSLPSGQVTFLFTDIDGSTRLWERDAAAMARALERHNALLGQAIAGQGGVHFKTIGDAFQAAFADPAAAVRAAAAAQHALASERWRETGPLRVRMALHLGEARPDAAGDYLAPCLNRLARLLATGFGGQVLLSERVAQAVAAALPAGVTVRALGRHRLRDLLAPELVSQLVIGGVPDTFPPLKSLEGHATNLPVLPTALIGRERERAALSGLLTGLERLVTLVGPGGVGKTHLALQTAADAVEMFEDGVWLVPLGEIQHAELLLPHLAEVLGVREGGGRDLREALYAHLAGQRALLILDNFEQIVAAAPVLGDLLGRCPRLRLLVTSRQRLAIAGERLFPVEPLPLPSPREAGAAARENPAVQLFLARAAAQQPGFQVDASELAVVASLCRRLDGLPLAIELAAAQAHQFTLTELLNELHDKFRLLAGRRDGLTHQQTLAATVAWSYDRLSPGEQSVFRALAVFAGGWSRAAAEAVVHPPGPSSPVLAAIAALHERNLLRRAEYEEESRWTMLETIRDYGRQRLADAGEDAVTRERHATWCLDFVTATNAAFAERDQVRWLALLAADHDNARSALAWCAGAGRPERLLALASALAPFWQIRGYLSEGRRWLDTALQHEYGTGNGDADGSGAAVLGAIIDAGILARAQDDNDAAEQLFQRALMLARETGDRGREAALVNNLATVALWRGQLAAAEEMFSEALAIAETLGDRRRRADVLGNLGAVAQYRGDSDGALTRYSAALAIWRELNDAHGVADMVLNLVQLLAPLPEHAARASAAGEEALRRFRELGDPQGEALALSSLGLLAAEAGDLDRAEQLHRQSLALFEEIEDRGGEASALGSLGLTALDRGELAVAREHLTQSLRLVAELGETEAIASRLDDLAALRLAEGDERAAARLYGAADALFTAVGIPRAPGMQARFAANRATLGERLGAAFALAWSEGGGLAADDAVAEALGERPVSGGSAPADALRSLDHLLGLAP